MKGWNKLVLNKARIEADLNQHSIILAEAIQTILRREGYPGAYELLKDLTRGNAAVTLESIAGFIEKLEVPAHIKEELSALTPLNYTGRFNTQP